MSLLRKQTHADHVVVAVVDVVVAVVVTELESAVV